MGAAAAAVVQTVRRLLLAFACAGACGAAHADRSRIDDAATDPGDCEVELAGERQTARGTATQSATSVQFDCGIGWRTELLAGFARRRSDAERAEAVDVEARTVLFDRGVAGSTWSLLYGVGAERATGRTWRTAARFVGLEAGWRPAAAWVIDAQLAVVDDRTERQRAWLRKLGVEHELSDRLEARVEFEDDNRSRPAVGVEVRYEFLPDRARVNLSYGVHGGTARERRLGLGIAFEF